MKLNANKTKIVIAYLDKQFSDAVQIIFSITFNGTLTGLQALKAAFKTEYGADQSGLQHFLFALELMKNVVEKLHLSPIQNSPELAMLKEKIAIFRDKILTPLRHSFYRRYTENVKRAQKSNDSIVVMPIESEEKLASRKKFIQDIDEIISKLTF